MKPTAATPPRARRGPPPPRTPDTSTLHEATAQPPAEQRALHPYPAATRELMAGPPGGGLARRGRKDHEPDVGHSSSRPPRLPVFMDDGQENHPGSEVASADRPPATDTVSAGDDPRLPGRPRTIARN